MNLEKRSEDGDAMEPKEAQEPQQPPAEQPPQDGKKPGKRQPVFLYMMILFGVAFCLILMSFFMHQRSNQEVLGELHNNVNALEQLQDALDENLRLEKELEKAQDELRDQEEAAAKWEATADASARTTAALLLLYQLQQQYAARDLTGCQATIEQMEAEDAAGASYVEDLPTAASASGLTSPAQRFTQLKTAVEDLMAALPK